MRNPADGSRQEEVLLVDPARVIVPWSWAGDDAIATTELALNSQSGFDIGLLKQSGGRWAREPLLDSQEREAVPFVSPSGRWMAYARGQGGSREIEVRAFPAVASRKESVPSEGGDDPVWSGDGRTLFYRRGDAMMAMPVQDGPVFATETPSVLFRGDYFTEVGRQWDVSPDGTRFIMLKPAAMGEDSGTRPQINVVENWAEELKRTVPVGK